MQRLIADTGNDIKRLDSVFQLRQEPTKKLYQWWLDKCGNDIPDWRDFDILDFFPYAPMMSLTLRRHDGRFFYKLQGEEVLSLLPDERAKQPDIRPDHEHPYERGLYDQYDRICNSRLAHYYVGRIQTLPRSFTAFESVDLPFKNDQNKATRILSLMVSLN